MPNIIELWNTIRREAKTIQETTHSNTAMIINHFANHMAMGRSVSDTISLIDTKQAPINYYAVHSEGELLGVVAESTTMNDSLQLMLKEHYCLEGGIQLAIEPYDIARASGVDTYVTIIGGGDTFDVVLSQVFIY
jgi:hypothetical protein